MLRVAIVGCGKIADQHAEHIASIPGCTLVAVCDQEGLMARQLMERYDVPQHYTDVRQLIESSKPDVVHITTPPASHFPLTKLCLEGNCHVYVEKPFTVTFQEAERLIEIAEQRQLKLTVGHHAQYSHAAQRMRSLIRTGYLGGAAVHIEAYYCYDFGDPAFAKALLGDSAHWVRSLPGGLLQNTISHGVSKIAELLTGSNPTVIAHGFTSAMLRGIGEHSVIDELRVIIRDGDSTAYFTFSSQMRPTLHQLRVYGPKNALVMDEEQQTVIRLRGRRYKSYLEKFVPPFDFAKQYLGNVIGNAKRFAAADFHQGHGMRALIQSFYRAISEGEHVPIPHREILLTAKIMDEIFAQVQTRSGVNQKEFAER